MDSNERKKAKRRTPDVKQDVPVQVPSASPRFPFYLHEWARGKPVIVAMNAQMAVAMLPIVWAGCDAYRSGEAAKRLASQPVAPDVWLAQYRSPMAVKKRLIDLFWGGNSEAAKRSLVSRFFLEAAVRAKEQGLSHEAIVAAVTNLPYPAKEQIRAQLEPMLQYQYQQHLLGLAELVAGLDDEPGLNMEKAFADPAALFVVGSLLPCMLSYQEWAWDLYERARLGHTDAIKKLLQVDKHALHDEDIRRHAVTMGPDGNRNTIEVAADGLKGVADYPEDRKTINYLVCSLVARSAKTVGYKLNGRDLKKLIDAAAKDRTGDKDAIDENFGDAPEARRQALHRYKPLWNNVIGRDMDFDLACHAALGTMVLVSDAHAKAECPKWLADQAREREDPRRGWWSGVVPSAARWRAAWGHAVAAGLFIGWALRFRRRR